MAITRCKVDGCKRKHHAKGYCNKHYNKYRVYGDPEAGRFLNTTPTWQRKKYPKKSRTLQAAPDLIKKPEGAARQDFSMPDETAWIPERKHERKPSGSQSNLSFFLNQPFIERIYSEIQKATKEPLYVSANYMLVDSMLSLAAGLAGYDCKNQIVWEEYSKELLQWTEQRDKVRFMEALANWPQRVKEYTPKKPIQLSFDNMIANKVNSR